MRLTLLAAAAALSLAACASGGGEAGSAPAAQDRSLQERAAAVTAPLGPPPESAPEEVALEALADPPTPEEEAAEPGAIIVPGERDPLPTPPGDPRTVDQRMADIRAWDRCILRAQAQMTDGQPGRLQESPEELCRRALGMRDRLSIPVGD